MMSLTNGNVSFRSVSNPLQSMPLSCIVPSQSGSYLRPAYRFLPSSKIGEVAFFKLKDHLGVTQRREMVGHEHRGFLATKTARLHVAGIGKGDHHTVRVSVYNVDPRKAAGENVLLNLHRLASLKCDGRGDGEVRKLPGPRRTHAP